MAKVEIVNFSERWAEEFASLNYEWIEAYFTIEKHDREVLDHPGEYVIAPGGTIFMAIVGGMAVGTVALIPAGDGVLELTKMAVSTEFQGMGIGDKLMARCVEYAVEHGVHTMWLESHTRLAPAISLYRKHGFIEVQTDPDSLYSRADIKMQLAL